MNNPFKIIGLSFIISILAILTILELPKTLINFKQSEWLVAMFIMALATISMLVNILSNAQKIHEKTKQTFNHFKN